MRVLRYLKYTIIYEFHYSKYPPILEGYNNANCASDAKRFIIRFYIGRRNSALEVLEKDLYSSVYY